MSGSEKISPNNTYVLDESMLDEMDSIELTGLLNELSAQLGDEDELEPVTADLESEPLDDDDTMTIEIEIDADHTDD